MAARREGLKAVFGDTEAQGETKNTQGEQRYTFALIMLVNMYDD